MRSTTLVWLLLFAMGCHSKRETSNESSAPPGAQVGELSSAEKEALVAATQWLALVDAGRFDASYDAAAGYFKGTLTKEDWMRMVNGVRTPLGAVRARDLASAKAARTLPGAPDGEYVVIQYQSKFENKAQAVETVTPTREPDGQWRVVGYFVH